MGVVTYLHYLARYSMGFNNASVQVLAIGDKVESDKFSVKKGDTILYSKYGTSDVEAAKGSRVVFVGKDSILGVCV